MMYGLPPLMILVWTLLPLAATTPIRAAHLMELRAAVVALE